MTRIPRFIFHYRIVHGPALTVGNSRLAPLVDRLYPNLSSHLVCVLELKHVHLHTGRFLQGAWASFGDAFRQDEQLTGPSEGGSWSVKGNHVQDKYLCLHSHTSLVFLWPLLWNNLPRN